MDQSIDGPTDKWLLESRSTRLKNSDNATRYHNWLENPENRVGITTRIWNNLKRSEKLHPVLKVKQSISKCDDYMNTAYNSLSFNFIISSISILSDSNKAI